MSSFFLHVSIFLLAFSPIIAYGQQESRTLESALPGDCCLHLSIKSPGENLCLILESLEIEGLDLLDIYRQLLTTNLVDATTQIETLATPEYLLQSRSLHFFVRDSEKSVSSFGFAIELDDESQRPSRESLKPIISTLSFVGRKLLANRSKAGGQLDNQISMFESGYRCTQVGRWVIVTHDRSTETAMVDNLQPGKGKRSGLSSTRAYVAAQDSCLDDAFLTCYLLPRRAKSLLNLWQQEVNQSLETVAWIQYSAQIKDTSVAPRLNLKTVFRRSEPAGGSSKYWDFYRAIEHYPAAELGNWQTLGAQNVDSKAWLERYKSDVSEASGRPVDSRSKDAVAKFLAGEGRSELGGNMVFAQMDDLSEQTWYFIGDRDKTAAAQQVTDFFVGMDKNYRQVGYDAQLDLETEGVWSLEIANAIDYGEEGPTLGDFGGDPYAGQKKDSADNDQVNVSWASKYAQKLDQWIVIGSKKAVVNAIRSYGKDFVETDFERVGTELKEFGIENQQPHKLIFVKPAAVMSSLRAGASDSLNRIFGFAWRLSDKAFDKVLKEGPGKFKLTNPQLLGFFVRRMVDRIERIGIRYSKYELIKDNQFLILESWNLSTD